VSVARPSGAGLEVAGLVAESFLMLDLPGATPAQRRAAAAEVVSRVRAMPDLMRLGFRVAGAASYVVLSVLARRPFARVPPARRAGLVLRLAAMPMPILGEYVRLTRGLALAAAVESRTVRGGGDA
jgi:hypothetical protein